MKVIIEWTETIERRSVIECESPEEARRLIEEYDDEITKYIENVSVEVDGGGFTIAAADSAVVLTGRERRVT